MRSKSKKSIVNQAKAFGAILGAPLVLFVIVSSVIDQPLVGLVVGLVSAVLASFLVADMKWAGLLEIAAAWLVIVIVASVVLKDFIVLAPAPTPTLMPTSVPTHTPTKTPTPTPTLTPTKKPMPTPALTPTKTSMPTNTPTLIFTPKPMLLSVTADFEGQAGINNLGGMMGAAYSPPDSLVETYVQDPEHSFVARLEYDIQGWSAFWMQLKDADLTPYSKLIFDIRADPAVGIPGKVKIELKRAGNQQVSIIYISGITANWQTMVVNLADFGPTGYTDPLSSFIEMEELVFIFEASRSGTQGVVYLDNITFVP